MTFPPLSMRPLPLILASALGLAACDQTGTFDFDLRDTVDGFDTSTAVRQAVAAPPRPDSRGIVSYPSYQVAVAQRGDTVQAVASRVGLPADEVARYNGLPPNVPLRRGEIIALPRRVAEPSPATGAPIAGPIRPALETPGLAVESITSTPLEQRAGEAIRRAEARGIQTGQEPTRHQVARGETAFSIARRYGVPVRALAEWNSLDADMTVREGSFLLIPVATEAPPESVTAPGAGSVAPAPPSAVQPLPDEQLDQAPPRDVPASPDLGAQSAGGKFVFPVTGPIIRPYRKGRNDGIDISATPGTPVRAADAGTVAAITRDTDQVPILVLRHPGNILTVYAGVEGIGVQKGDSVARGQTVARIRDTDPSFLHFEVREGFDSVDPVGYLE
ncbi:peptidoglycan DD-metalloendopeptidase family protein [Maribius pontilimi]|uniref:Peptidoglycan DD-metalloendopeptidase family protein n=1 Tax=Palleronia pontilimi TaxID=1964209 RepID=A0A934I955_9RHOB|nr:peptidoglycan DD-metalloendopeptidase family protein [Palleronia pontilimi]MBJ3762774.1 peptidoglycan DD-metalloendopeptidase family protein [Palleronia pontilimi]